MRREYVAFIAILGLSSCFLYANAQDFSFPGPTERPSRFPLPPNNGQRPQNPNNNNNGQWPQNPSNNNGQWPQNPNNNNGQRPQNPNNNNNGQFPQNPNNNNNGQWPQNPNNNNNGQFPQNPNNNNNGQFPQNPNNNNNGQFPQNPNNNNNGQFPQNPNNNNNGQFPQNPNNNNNPNGGITQEQYNTCVDNCLFTSEYNPQCGSDGVTYQNPGALNCAINCGNPIQNLGRAPCTTTTTSTTARPAVPPNSQGTAITQEQYNTCVDSCQFTSEYSPQCGSDGVTYQNLGALNCAINCGNPIQNLGRAPCTTPSPVGK